MTSYMCPVCGWTGLAELPRSPAGGGSYEICWCCGFEFGVTDDDLGYTYEQWRNDWIQKGMPWDGSSIRPAPDGWDPAEQLRRLQLPPAN